jgi:fructose-bisphosphate aldolase, class II
MKGTAEIIEAANSKGILVPAFNIPYLPMMEPVTRAIKDQEAFCLLEVSRVEWEKFEAKSTKHVMEEYKKWADNDFMRLHLDHVPVIDEDQKEVDYIPIVETAIKLGYQSVMVDGSRLSLEANIEATKKVAALAHKAGIPCEAELGAVMGHEEGPPPPYEEIFNSGKGFTKIEEAQRFVNESGCDWLSVAVGSIHGAISEAFRHQKKPTAKIDLEHLEKLRKVTRTPLVLHGGSGVAQEYVLKAAEKGITKVNVGTEIRQAYEEGLKEKKSVAAAQDATYYRVVDLIRNYFYISGKQKEVV